MYHSPQVRMLADEKRLHLQHGPIDLIIEAFGPNLETQKAYQQAVTGFQGILSVLVGELDLLRLPLKEITPDLRGPVARRMLRATWPYRNRFITPMAAVAGAVADEVLRCLIKERKLKRAYVNNGGDIALFICENQTMDVGIVGDVSNRSLAGSLRIPSSSSVRGVATSGFGGRSHTFGIADAVTALAGNAAEADAAATIIANQVKVEDPAVLHCPANELDDNSDLTDQKVTHRVGSLEKGKIRQAIEQGRLEAQELLTLRLIQGAAIFLRNESEIVGEVVRNYTPLH